MSNIDALERVFRFDRDRMAPGESHNGHGVILAERVKHCPAGSNINHVDLVIVEPGARIGHHRHARDNEEFYIVIEGIADMQVEDRKVTVCPGDVIMNPPGGAHGLLNMSDAPVKLVVIEVRVPT